MITAGPINQENHPCFGKGALHKFGRIHLPVAPRCNIQCHFCNRKFDCANECRPGVTSVVMSPAQALEYAKEALARRSDIAVAGIAGPGDPFANPAETMDTLRMLRQHFPSLLMCVATNGLAITPHIEELSKLKVSHVTITISAVDPAIGACIYAWIRDEKRPLRGQVAASILLERQLEAIKKLKACGIQVKINSIVIPGINQDHIIEVAKTVSGLGADIMNVVALITVPGTEFEKMQSPPADLVEHIRNHCSQLIPQMAHCSRCRSDAVGLLSEGMNDEKQELLRKHSGQVIPNCDSRPYVAAVSHEGVFVNQHLGEATHIMIFAQKGSLEGEYYLKEVRQAPKSGSGESRWREMAATLRDCSAMLVSAAGPAPMQSLSQHGLRVIEMEGFIEEGLRSLFSNQALPPSLKRRFIKCGRGQTCHGTGTGCG